MAAGFAAGVAARIRFFGLLEPLARRAAVAAELESDALAEQRAGMAAVHGESLVELGHGLVQLAVGEERLALGDVAVGVGDELDVEHSLAHHLPHHHAQRTAPPKAR